MFQNRLVALVLAALLLSSCGSKSSEPLPPEIIYGQEMCDRCGMIISDVRFASAILLNNGEYRKFDDVGEMLAYQNDHPDEQVDALFVHDYLSEEWIRGETAFYVQSEDLQTPMGSGIVAFANQVEAESFAVEWHGKVQSLDDLRSGVIPDM